MTLYFSCLIFSISMDFFQFSPLIHFQGHKSIWKFACIYVEHHQSYFRFVVDEKTFAHMQCPVGGSRPHVDEFLFACWYAHLKARHGYRLLIELQLHWLHESEYQNFKNDLEMLNVLFPVYFRSNGTGGNEKLTDQFDPQGPSTLGLTYLTLLTHLIFWFSDSTLISL